MPLLLLYKNIVEAGVVGCFTESLNTGDNLSGFIC